MAHQFVGNVSAVILEVPEQPLANGLFTAGIVKNLSHLLGREEIFQGSFRFGKLFVEQVSYCPAAELVIGMEGLKQTAQREGGVVQVEQLSGEFRGQIPGFKTGQPRALVADSALQLFDLQIDE